MNPDAVARKSIIETQLKVNAADLDAFNKKLDSLESGANGVTKAIQEASKYVKAFNDSLGSAGRSMTEFTNKASTTNKSTSNSYKSLSNDVKDQFNKMNAYMDKGQTSAKKFAESADSSFDKFRTSADKNVDSYKSKIDALITKNKEAMASIQQLQKQRVTPSIPNTSGHYNTNTTSGRVGSDRLERIGNNLVGNGMNMSFTSLGLGAGFIQGAKDATSLQNEQVKIGNLATTGGEDPEEVKKQMKEIAKQRQALSQKYGVDQNEIAQGYETLVRRGYTTKQAKEAQKYVTQGAIASGDDYNDVVDNATSVIDAFGLKRGSEATKNAINKMAYASDLTATDFKDMGLAMQYTGPTAKAANQTLGNTSAALGVLSNAGQTGSVAGTSMRDIYNRLTSPTKNGQNALSNMGVNIEDAKGQLRPLQDIFADMNAKMKDMSKNEKMNVFHRIFGTTGQDAALILSNNVDGLKKLNKEIDNAQNYKGGGYIQALSDKNMKSYQSRINQFKQAWKAFSISMANTLMPTVTTVMHGLTDVFNAINNMPKGTKTAIAGFTLFVAAIGPVSLAVGGVLKAVNSTRKAIGWLSGSLRSKPGNGFVGDMNRQATQAQRAADKFAEANAIMDRSGNRAREAYTVAPKRTVASKIAGADLGTLREKESRGAFRAAKEVQVGGSFSRSIDEVSKSRRFLSRFGGKGSTGTRFGRVGNANVISEASAIAKDAGGLSKFAKFANVAGKGVVGLNIATSALGMLGTNDKNMFKNLGGAGGAAAGGAIGAIGGPIGIAAGSAIGQWLGTKGGEIVQRSVNKSSKMYNDPSHEANKSTNGIADSLRNFNNNSELINSLGNNKQSKEMRGILSGQNRDAIKNARSAVNKYTDSGTQSSKSDADKLNGYLMNNAKIDSKKIAESDKDLYKKRQKDANDALTALAKTEGQGGKKRQKAIKRANEAISKLMTSSNAGQRRIMAQLTTSTGKMSDKEAGKLIANSSKIANEQIANANREYKQSKAAADKKYKSVLDAANRQYYDTGQISKSQYNEIIKNAKGDRDDSIKTANDKRKGIVSEATKQKNKVVEQARKQTKDHLASVDEETGKSLDFWGRWGKRFKGIWNGISSWFGGIWKGITSKISDISSSVGKKFKGTAIGKGIENIKATDKKFWGGVGRWVQGYATGTTGRYPNGLPKATNAIVNDGNGRELIQYPDGNMFLPKGRNVNMMLPKGTHIFNADDTRKLIGAKASHFASGTTRLKGVNGHISVSLNIKSVRAAINATKRGMQQVQSMIMRGYKQSNATVEKEMKLLSKVSAKEWKEISNDTGKLTDKSSKDTIKTYEMLQKQLDKTMDKIHDGMNDNTKAMVVDFGSIMGKLAGLAGKAMKATIDQLNHGVSGINSALGQFGNSNVLKPIKYATGSKGKLPSDQIAMVNDATSGPRQEAIVRDNKVYLPKGQNTVMKLNKGDQVLNGRQTQKLLSGIKHYAKGSGVSDDELTKIAKNNAKEPNKAFNNEFLNNVKALGPQLQKGLTSVSKGAAKSVGQPWTKAMWSLINNTIGGEGGSGSMGAFLKYAEKIGMGKKYIMGATGPDAFDCSGLIYTALKHFGIDIGRNTVAQQNSSGVTRLGKDVNKAKVGDLAIFGHGGGANGHVGIVSNVAKGLMMNATPPSGRISSIKAAEPYVPGGLDAFYHINGLHSDDDKKDKSSGFLSKLVQRQLGKKAINWITKHLGQTDMGGGAGGDSPAPTGNHEHWLKQAGIDPSDFSAANYIITRESGWNPHAQNPTSPAYGIPQSLPGSKMATAGSDWRDNPITQLKWMKGYVKGRYGGFKQAQAYWAANHNYANGGWSNKPATFGEVPGEPEVVINPKRNSADGLIQSAINARSKVSPESPIGAYASHLKHKRSVSGMWSGLHKAIAKGKQKAKPVINVTFNNTFNITGNTSQGAVTQMTGQMEMQFKRFLDQYLGLAVDKTINNKFAD